SALDRFSEAGCGRALRRMRVLQRNPARRILVVVRRPVGYLDLQWNRVGALEFPGCLRTDRLRQKRRSIRGLAWPSARPEAANTPSKPLMIADATVHGAFER